MGRVMGSVFITPHFDRSGGGKLSPICNISQRPHRRRTAARSVWHHSVGVPGYRLTAGDSPVLTPESDGIILWYGYHDHQGIAETVQK